MSHFTCGFEKVAVSKELARRAANKAEGRVRSAYERYGRISRWTHPSAELDGRTSKMNEALKAGKKTQRQEIKFSAYSAKKGAK